MDSCTQFLSKPYGIVISGSDFNYTHKLTQNKGFNSAEDIDVTKLKDLVYYLCLALDKTMGSRVRFNIKLKVIFKVLIFHLQLELVAFVTD